MPATLGWQNCSRRSADTSDRGRGAGPVGAFEGCAFEPRCADRMKICCERTPELFEIENGGKVRCFKFGG